MTWNRSLSWTELFFGPATWQRCRNSFSVSSLLGSFLDVNASLTLFWSKPSVWVATTKSWVRTEVTFPGNIPSSFFLTFDILSDCYWGWLYLKLWVTGDDFLLLMECSRSSVKCCYWMLAAWCLLWQEFICTVTNIFKQAGFYFGISSLPTWCFIYEYYIYH